MRRRARRAQATIVATLIALLGTSSAWASVPDAAKRGWVEVRTRNFTALAPSSSDASDMARHLERLREVLIATHPTLDAAAPPAVRVYAFPGEGPLKSYAPRGSERAAGFNAPADDGDLIAFDAGEAENARNRIVQHEYLHSIVRHNLVRAPTWLDEGLAEYYSTFTAKGSSADIGRAVPQSVAWLREKRLMPLEELFAITTDSPDYRSGQRRNTFYAESWALVHYLSQGPPDQVQRFQRYLKRLRRGHPPLDAFAEVAPRERWPELLRQLDAYCKQATFSYWSYTFATPFASVPQQERALSKAETLERLGELAALNDEPDARLAEEHFRLAIATDSLAALAMANLGYLLDRRGDTIHAESLYTAAGELAAREPRLWILAARGALDRYGRGRGRASSSSALEISRVRFAHALALDAGNLQAMIGYGRTFRDEREPSALAIAAMTTASLWLPARMDVAFDLAVLLARADRCVEADSVFRERIEPLGAGAGVSTIGRAVFDCWLARAVKLQGEGQADPARRALDQAIASTADTALIARARERFRPVPRQWSRRIPAGERLGAPSGALHEEAVTAFDRGLAAANQQHFEEAIRQLEHADSLAEEGVFRDNVQEVLASVRARSRLRDAIALINAGDLAGARRLIDQVASGPMDDSTRAYVARLRKRTDTRIALEQGARTAVGGNLDAARGVFDSVLASRADDDLRAYAKALGGQVQTHREMEQGIALLRAGHLVEARARFVALRQTPMTRDESARVDALVRHTDARLEIERALGLVRSGDVEGARKALSAVLGTPIGASLRAYAEGLLRQLPANPGH